MLDEDKVSKAQASEASADDTAPPSSTCAPAPDFDESIIEELGGLIEDAGLYATAELAFQKNRAKLAGKNVAIAALVIVLALILLHLSLIALAVGMVMALEPIFTIWGAIGIVVGIMLLATIALVMIAWSKARLLSEIFAPAKSVASDQGAEE